MNKGIKSADEIITSNETAKMETMVSEFNSAYRKSAEQILEMCRIAAEAKSMGKGIYALFCERVMMKSDSMMGKFVTIGMRYNLFIEHQDQLPSQWTTLYNLTYLKDDEFIEKCLSGEINPNIGGAESLRLANKISTKKPRGNNPISAADKTEPMLGLGVYISSDSYEMAIALKDILELAKAKGLTVRRSADYEIFEEASNDSSLKMVA